MLSPSLMNKQLLKYPMFTYKPKKGSTYIRNFILNLQMYVPQKLT